jgi:hypothetical protein
MRDAAMSHPDTGQSFRGDFAVPLHPELLSGNCEN